MKVKLKSIKTLMKEGFVFNKNGDLVDCMKNRSVLSNELHIMGKIVEMDNPHEWAIEEIIKTSDKVSNYEKIRD